MSSIKLDIVTAERAVYAEDVDMVIAPGVEGQLGILPHHAPLMTILQAGELRVKKGGEEISLAISFLSSEGVLLNMSGNLLAIVVILFEKSLLKTRSRLNIPNFRGQVALSIMTI